MLTDTALRQRGLEVLTEGLGILDSERFISLILSEPFDYTEWQRGLYGDMPLDEFYEKVKAAR
jgi:hypothetical protein